MSTIPGHPTAQQFLSSCESNSRTEPTSYQTLTRKQIRKGTTVEDIMTFSLQLVPCFKLLVVTRKLVPCLPIGSYPSILSVWTVCVCVYPPARPPVRRPARTPTRRRIVIMPNQTYNLRRVMVKCLNNVPLVSTL